MFKKIGNTIFHGVVFSITVLMIFGSVFAWTNLTDVAGDDPLTATLWNNMIAKINENGNKLVGVSNTSGDLETTGTLIADNQPHIAGSVNKSSGGSGLANEMTVYSSKGGLTWNSDRITISKAGVYLITYTTISQSTSGRVDADVLVNGSNVIQLLSENNGSGYHQKSGSIAVFLNSGDYIQFNNNDWYNPSQSNFESWRTASVTLLN